MIEKLLKNINNSGIKRWFTNQVLYYRIPFNSPHKIRVTACTDESLSLTLPFIRKNKNHINSMHACALATLCEYVTGLQLARAIDTKTYRLILQEININYSFQAKKDVMSTFKIPAEEIKEIMNELSEHNMIIRVLLVEVSNGERTVCTGRIKWQIKNWSVVNTKAGRIN
jgi:acyl-coenzyme A thioesterase PaaI-like protein